MPQSASSSLRAFGPESPQPESSPKKAPPVFKWLLNERAALAGKVVRLEAGIAAIQCEVRGVQKKVAALDATIAALDPRVAPDAAGVVHAWAGRFGKRGALTECVHDHLQKAGAKGISTTALALQVAQALGVDLPSKKHLKTFRKQSVQSVLRRAKANGTVEGFPRGPAAPAVWRWIGRSKLPTFGLLRDLGSPHDPGSRELIPGLPRGNLADSNPA